MKKLTRDQFTNIIKDFPEWRNHLSERQLNIIDIWYTQNKTYEQTAHEMGCSRDNVSKTITGQNRSGKNGIVMKLELNKNKRRVKR